MRVLLPLSMRKRSLLWVELFVKNEVNAFGCIVTRISMCFARNVSHEIDDTKYMVQFAVHGDLLSLVSVGITHCHNHYIRIY